MFTCVAFVNYPCQAGGEPVSEYRFLDANTGEFAWRERRLTNQFFMRYYHHFIPELLRGPIRPHTSGDILPPRRIPFLKPFDINSIEHHNMNIIISEMNIIYV